MHFCKKLGSTTFSGIPSAVAPAKTNKNHAQKNISSMQSMKPICSFVFFKPKESASLMEKYLVYIDEYLSHVAITITMKA
jgi:hypothetical protein